MVHQSSLQTFDVLVVAPVGKKTTKNTINQWTAKYNVEPLKTLKEIEALAQKGIKRYVVQEVRKGRNYQEVGDELGMTRANVERIMRLFKE